jgi:hypothetical protein
VTRKQIAGNTAGPRYTRGTLDSDRRFLVTAFMHKSTLRIGPARCPFAREAEASEEPGHPGIPSHSLKARTTAPHGPRRKCHSWSDAGVWSLEAAGLREWTAGGKPQAEQLCDGARRTRTPTS